MAYGADYDEDQLECPQLVRQRRMSACQRFRYSEDPIPDVKGANMGLFGRKKYKIPEFRPEDHEPVLKCSICTGEQIFCIRDRKTGDIKELMFVTSPVRLQEICSDNGIDPESVRKIY